MKAFPGFLDLLARYGLLDIWIPRHRFQPRRTEPGPLVYSTHWLRWCLLMHLQIQKSRKTILIPENRNHPEKYIRIQGNSISNRLPIRDWISTKSLRHPGTGLRALPFVLPRPPFVRDVAPRQPPSFSGKGFRYEEIRTEGYCQGLSPSKRLSPPWRPSLY